MTPPRQRPHLLAFHLPALYLNGSPIQRYRPRVSLLCHKGLTLGARLLGVTLLLSPLETLARPPRVNHVPSGVDLGCQTCHFSPAGGAVNAFGYDIQLTLQGGEAQWAEVCALDSDLDGYSNGVELGDSSCVWRIGSGPPPDAEAIISYPGDPNSLPIEPPDLGVDMMTPDMELDMELPVDLALPDQDPWDAWLDRPTLEDGFSVSPIDDSPPPEDLMTSPEGDMEELTKLDLSTDERDASQEADLELERSDLEPQEAGAAPLQGGARGGGLAGGDEVEGDKVSEAHNQEERALEDQLSGCQRSPMSGAPLSPWFMLLSLGSLGSIMQKQRRRLALTRG